MTVAAQTPSITYTENGITTAFAVPFRYDNPADLRAVRRWPNGADTALLNGTDFVATSGLTSAGGTLTVTVAGAAGTLLTINRVTPRVQEADYITSGAFTAESHEKALDRSVLMVQELDVTFDRAVKAPEGEAGLDMAPRGTLDGKTLTVVDDKIVGGTSVADPLPIKTITGTSYTLEASDAFVVLETISASPVTITIPADATVDLPLGAYLEIHAGAAGLVTCAAAPGVTLQSRGNVLALAGQHAVVGLRKMAANRWRLAGDVA